MMASKTHFFFLRFKRCSTASRRQNESEESSLLPLSSLPLSSASKILYPSLHRRCLRKARKRKHTEEERDDRKTHATRRQTTIELSIPLFPYSSRPRLTFSTRRDVVHGREGARLQARNGRAHLGGAGGKRVSPFVRRRTNSFFLSTSAHLPHLTPPPPTQKNKKQNVDRRERLRRLAMETIDITKDPYFMRNHQGQYECRLCLTVHKGEGSYLAHTQGRRHQGNMAKRAAREAASSQQQATIAPRPAVPIKKGGVKIGRPGYRVTKQFDPEKNQRSLLFQIEYPEIASSSSDSSTSAAPRHRFMSCFEQRKEAPDRAWQYVLFAAEPYETIAFKVPNAEVERGEDFFVHWDSDAKIFSVQLPFKPGAKVVASGGSGFQAAMPPPPPMQQMQMPPPPPPPGFLGGGGGGGFNNNFNIGPPPPGMMMSYPPPPQYGGGGGGGGGGYGGGGGGGYRGGPPPPPRW